MLRKSLLPCCAVVAVTVGMAATSQSASAVLVAEWLFEGPVGTTFLDDTSGNGHTLANVGATVGSASPSVGSTQSARFNGSAIMNTVASLDLSGYSKVDITWWQFVDVGAPVGIVFEHGPNSAVAGDFLATVNEVAPGVGRPALITAGGADTDQLAHGSGVWEEFSMSIDLLASSPNIVQTMNITTATPGVSDFAGGTVVPFLDHIFYLGERQGGGVAPLLGNIDDLRINATLVPEPSTFVMLALGGMFFVARRRRKA